MNTFTLLVWEQIPEETNFYLIPNEEVEKDNRWQLMRLAHHHFINVQDKNDGMTFLSHALCSEDNIDDESYFNDHLLHMGDGTVKQLREPYPREWRCIFAKYKVDGELPIENTNITRVILSGFYM